MMSTTKGIQFALLYSPGSGNWSIEVLVIQPCSNPIRLQQYSNVCSTLLLLHSSSVNGTYYATLAVSASPAR
ncbi:hypothetical protein HZ326_17495 [Fusarium oxysporum f. sp. albedinis]|nr:hypothetical protein HZ326_17495 [Fusarium oxysporum f. sp. albedinis]